MDTQVDDGKRHRCWVFTHNNYTDTDVDFWKNYDKATYMVFGKEIAPTTGTPHLQGFFSFPNARTHSVVKKEIPKVWFQPAYAPASAAIYTKKDGDIYERGERPVHDQKENGKRNWAEIKALAEEGKFDEIAPAIYITQMNNLQRVYDRAQTKRKLEELPQLDNLWVVGKTGTGKSRYVRDTYGESIYEKSYDKWWTGYEGEDTVYLEDFDPKNRDMIGDLKRWADHYPFPVVAHYRKMNIRPKRIVVTSNYTPDQIWYQDEDLKPILRRFKIKTL